MHKFTSFLSSSFLVWCYFLFPSMIYGAENGDISKDFNSRFFQISRLMGEEHKKLRLPPEKDITDLCEERTFARIRREYDREDTLKKLESFLLPLYRPEMYKFAIEAVQKFFQDEDLTCLGGGHVRSYLQIVDIPFTSIYLEEYDKLNSRKTSYIESLNNYPQSKIAFDALAREMKDNPSMLEDFLNYPDWEDLRTEIIEYVKTL